ncbi:E3 ubiquitin-protein ligase RNF26 [Bombina bombina]|uniref:E3 ubiquitin-protein ligase RNF26 n=1 Tax=Bombina bombina TaxID=8345 RepID=UPI00235B051F|nr:E3 ubiquitin-protein ligase RNF26 [Bombina bombina]
MQVLLILLNSIRWTLDLLFLVLDLNYWLMSSLLSLLFWTIRFTLGLPGLLSMGLVHCWEGLLGLVARAGDSCCSLALGGLQAAGDLLRGGLVGLDSLKLVWNLLSHVVLRSREMVHRGLINIGTSGQALNRQMWEALGIAGSLAAYLVNSLVNMCLIAVQNVLSLVMALWFSLNDVCFTGLELAAELLSHISSSALAVVILLWTPCQLALDGVTSLSRGLGMILLRNLYEVLLLLFLIWLSRALSRQTAAIHQFRRGAGQLYHMFFVCAYAILNSAIWRIAATRSSQLFRRYRAVWERYWNQRTRIHNPPGRIPGEQNPPLRAPAERNLPMRIPRAQIPPIQVPGVQNPPARVPLAHNPSVRALGAQNHPMRDPGAHNPIPTSSVTERNTVSVDGGETSQDPWKLLKQQEESKKCVICQDETKTVLLLPCRHLCLCEACTQLLLQQPILQRNCPLCRHMILQTLNVYI